MRKRHRGRRLVEPRESLHRRDETVDPRRRRLDFRRGLMGDAARGNRAQRERQRPIVERRREPIEDLNRHARTGERLDIRKLDVMGAQPGRRSRLRGRRARAGSGRRGRSRTRKSSGPDRPSRLPRGDNPAAPSARALASSSSNWRCSDLAPRTTAEAGLFSSCASPAAHRPSEFIFSTWKSLEVNWRARSSITCTSMAVSSGHPVMSSRKQFRWTVSTSVASSTVTSPGAEVILEYGR